MSAFIILVSIVVCFLHWCTGACFILLYRCLLALLWRRALFIDYRQLVRLTHPLLQFVCWCQELHEEFMLEWVPVFSEVVCNIIGWGNVRYCELPLACAISYPVEAHVDCLGASLFYWVGSDANSIGVIAHDNSRGLRVAKIGENGSQTSCLLSACE